MLCSIDFLALAASAVIGSGASFVLTASDKGPGAWFRERVLRPLLARIGAGEVLDCAKCTACWLSAAAGVALLALPAWVVVPVGAGLVAPLLLWAITPGGRGPIAITTMGTGTGRRGGCGGRREEPPPGETEAGTGPGQPAHEVDSKAAQMAVEGDSKAG